MLCWLHVGDLHITGPDEQNIRDLREIVAQANRCFAEGVDFLFLPGDNANEGTLAQYALIRAALDEMRLPLRILPGDHDVEPGSLDAFHGVLGAPALPFAETIGGHRCLFLDIVSAGSGGPDFRLGPAQLAWLERELRSAQAMPGSAALFMHAYPRELHDCGERVAGLVARHDIGCIAMGHTHYNEVANDGTTIYSTVRSTGQIEEGPPGFALTAIDGSVVSWRFKPLRRPFPFCLITSPADERLLIDPARQIARGPIRVRARAWSDHEVATATARIDGGRGQKMRFDAQEHLWSAELEAPDGRHGLVVQVTDAAGQTDTDAITVIVGDGHAWQAPVREPAGSDANAIGAWPEKGIHGGQLGPNKNGRKW